MGAIVIDTPQGVEAFHLLQLKYALKLEIKGLKHRQGSVYAYIKKRFNLKGNKQRVYDQFCDMHSLDR